MIQDYSICEKSAFRYETGDILRDGIKILDKDNDIMTIISPGVGDSGTVYKPVDGKTYFDNYGK